MFENYFHLLGFNESEISAYLCLAELGRGTPSEVAKRVRLPRTSVYYVLESLLKRGLLDREEHGGKQIYRAREPDSIVDLIEREKSQVLEKERTARELVRLVAPMFKGKDFSVPKMRFFDGTKNVESMLYDNLDAWQESIAKVDNVWWGYQDPSFVDEYKKWLQHHWRLRDETQKIHILSHQSPTERKLQAKVDRRFIKFLPEKIRFGSTLWVCGEYIVMISTQKRPHYAFQIQDEPFAAGLRALFALLWKTF